MPNAHTFLSTPRTTQLIYSGESCQRSQEETGGEVLTGILTGSFISYLNCAVTKLMSGYEALKVPCMVSALTSLSVTYSVMAAFMGTLFLPVAKSTLDLNFCFHY